MGLNWTKYELLIAMNLYCRLPFGQFDQSNKHICEVAKKIDRTPGALAMKLSNLASLDSYHQNRGVVGLKGASKLDRIIWDQFQKNWSKMAEKSEQAFEAIMSDKEIRTHLATGAHSLDGPSETERVVKARRLQNFFRKVVLSSYENKCALTGIAVPQILVASHIIPWSESEERRADPTNGICLNALHDRAFDRHLITFDEDYRLIVSSLLKNGRISEFQSMTFANLEGTKLSLPHRFEPDHKALQLHRKAFLG